jgi:hypothetical protein
MPRTAQEPAELFAAYVEVTMRTAADHRRRRQWVILPPLPARLAPGDSPISGYLSWFERTQQTASHRAMWQYHTDGSGNFKRSLQRDLGLYEADGWSLTIPDGGILTCEIHPTELAQILVERKTPYRLLNRLQKVARSMHGLDIS